MAGARSGAGFTAHAWVAALRRSRRERLHPRAVRRLARLCFTSLRDDGRNELTSPTEVVGIRIAAAPAE